MRSQGVETVVVARRLLILGLTLAAPHLVGCSAPPPTDERSASTEAASVATPPAPAQVMIAFQPTQLCPSPAACLQGDELAWIPTGTNLDVSGLHVQELASSTVHWFRVEYEGSSGWISEMATDRAPRVRGGKVTRE